jgi:hypothetical protein
MENQTTTDTTDATNKAPLGHARLAVLVNRTEDYALMINGNNLAPRHPHGSIVVITPCFGVAPASIEAGTAVVVALADDDNPRCFSKLGVWLLNGDGDLTAGKDYRPAGSYIILGRVRDWKKGE